MILVLKYVPPATGRPNLWIQTQMRCPTVSMHKMGIDAFWANTLTTITRSVSNQVAIKKNSSIQSMHVHGEINQQLHQAKQIHIG